MAAILDVDHEGILARVARVPGNSKRMCASGEMKCHETARTHMRETLGTIEEPAGERLFALRQQGGGSGFCGVCVGEKNDRARLGETRLSEHSQDQSSAKEYGHDPVLQSVAVEQSPTPHFTVRASDSCHER